MVDMILCPSSTGPVPLKIFSICFRCHARLSRSYTIAAKLPQRSLARRKYFTANSLGETLDLGTGKATSFPVSTRRRNTNDDSQIPADSQSQNLSWEHQLPTSGLELLDRRRRLRSKDLIAKEDAIPHDASSQLSNISSSLPQASLRRLLTTCLSLSKPRLSFMIVLTTATAYSLYPVPAVLLPTTTFSPSLSTLTLAFLTSGTGLCCASANALNMLLEPEHDAKMSRTRNRPLVRGFIGKKGAFVFAAVAGTLGVVCLWFGVNPTVAFLGGANIFLYAAVYTPLKRISVLNTWVGALVGGIPPLMGWAAAAGQTATGNGEWQELLLGQGNAGGWLLASLLFMWQFPHFNALSWTIREEYKNAGYRMLAWTNPKMNGRIAFRYSLSLVPVCVGLWWVGVTDQGFLLTSSVVNAWIIREAWRFWRNGGYRGSARGLFWASVWHLPVIMVLAMAQKKGLWEGIWNQVVGENADEIPWAGEVDEVDGPSDLEENDSRVTAGCSV